MARKYGHYGAGVAIVAALVPFAVPGNAVAASGDTTHVYGAHMRSCGNANHYGNGPSDCPTGSVIGYLPEGDYRTYAYKDGGWVNGTARWFLVRGNTRCGWISASMTDDRRQAWVPRASSWYVNSQGCPR